MEIYSNSVLSFLFSLGVENITYTYFTIKYYKTQGKKVFDILGKEVAVLADDYKHAGYHFVKFDAVWLSSGIYFYFFKAGTYFNTGKMILSK